MRPVFIRKTSYNSSKRRWCTQQAIRNSQQMPTFKQVHSLYNFEENLEKLEDVIIIHSDTTKAPRIHKQQNPKSFLILFPGLTIEVPPVPRETPSSQINKSSCKPM